MNKTYLKRDKFADVAVIVICEFCALDAFFEWAVKITPGLLLFVAHCREAHMLLWRQKNTSK